jgi:hypothetical protein
MINFVILHGRLSRDVELRRTQSGVAVASTAVAVDRIDFCGPKDAGGRIATEPAAPRNDSYAVPAAAGDFAALEDDDSELPV